MEVYGRYVAAIAIICFLACSGTANATCDLSKFWPCSANFYANYTSPTFCPSTLSTVQSCVTASGCVDSDYSAVNKTFTNDLSAVISTCTREPTTFPPSTCNTPQLTNCTKDLTDFSSPFSGQYTTTSLNASCSKLQTVDLCVRNTAHCSDTDNPAWANQRKVDEYLCNNSAEFIQSQSCFQQKAYRAPISAQCGTIDTSVINCTAYNLYLACEYPIVKQSCNQVAAQIFVGIQSLTLTGIVLIASLLPGATNATKNCVIVVPPGTIISTTTTATVATTTTAQTNTNPTSSQPSTGSLSTTSNLSPASSVSSQFSTTLLASPGTGSTILATTIVSGSTISTGTGSTISGTASSGGSSGGGTASSISFTGSSNSPSAVTGSTLSTANNGGSTGTSMSIFSASGTPTTAISTSIATSTLSSIFSDISNIGTGSSSSVISSSSVVGSLGSSSSPSSLSSTASQSGSSTVGSAFTGPTTPLVGITTTSPTATSLLFVTVIPIAACAGLVLLAAIIAFCAPMGATAAPTAAIATVQVPIMAKPQLGNIPRQFTRHATRYKPKYRKFRYDV